MAKPAPRKAYIIRSFTDAGTGKTFAAGKTAAIEAGAFANYEAAGLVRTAPERQTAPATRRTARTRKAAHPRA